MIPVTVIGGYLGAGKTTLVNHLLRNTGGRRIAVLVNEFGELPIDADLIEAEGEDLIALAGGCICCAFGDDLMGTMQQISQRALAPDHVVIEASGVALPGSIALSIGLLDGFDLSGTVVLADAETVMQMARDEYIGDTILRQLSDADLLVLTKADLVATEQFEELQTWFGETAPRAGIAQAVHGAIASDIILGPQVIEKPLGQTHAHGANYLTETLSCSDPLDIEALGTALTQAGLLRAKGFLKGKDGRAVLIQLVGARLSVTNAAAQPPRLGIVCIGLRDRMSLSGLYHVMRATAAQRVFT